MKKDIQKIIYILGIISISVFLYVTNRIPGTFLVGWDNLYPELNFKENFLRSIFSVWQEYRGLGVEDGLAHGANIVHTIILFLLSHFLPLSSLRYVFQMGMHMLGGVGMFFLLTKGGKKKELFAFFGALFYQLNFITIQMFYAPLEVFSTHFAAIPWLFLSLFLFLEKPTKKRGILFFFTNILFTPQGFVPTVFIAYCTGVSSLLLVRMLTHLSSFTQECKKAIMVLSIIIITNSFWLFPFIHAAIKQGPTIKHTKINQLSSEIVYENNKNRGGVLDVLFLRGFMIDTTENNLKGQLDYIMKDWRTHLFQPISYSIQVLFATLFITGLVITLKKRHNKSSPHSFEDYFLPLILVCTVLLGTRIPLLSQINSFIRSSIPLFDEAFRFPFTKFSLMYAAGFTVFLVAGCEWIVHKVAIKKTSYVLLFVLFISLFWYAFPAFMGHFFYNELRLAPPNDYMQVISYMKSQDKSRRVMTLPQPSMWNWLYYNWGLRGSGFLWYGIAQPMLERPFDPWSNYNEQYFNEVFYALQKEDPYAFNQVIQKYDISYIFVDGYFQHTNKVQEFEKQQRFIESSTLHLEKHTFGKIIVYKLPQKEFITLEQGLTPIKQGSLYASFDTSYSDTHGYFASENAWNLVYPFSSIFTNKTQKDIPFSLITTQDSITLSPQTTILIPTTGSQYELDFSVKDKDQQLLPIKFKLEKNMLRILPYKATIQLNKKIVYVPFANEIAINVGTEDVVGITVNGIDADANGDKYYLAYLKAPNEIIIRFRTGSEKRISLSLKQSDFVSLPLEDNEITFSVTIPKIASSSLKDSQILENKTYETRSPCGEVITTGQALSHEQGSRITLTSRGNDNCIHQYVPGVSQNVGNVALIEVAKQQGLALRLIVDNPQQKTNIIDTKLDGDNTQKIITIPPTSNYLYYDYGLHLRNTGAGDSTSINTVSSIEMSYFPYYFFQNIKVIAKDSIRDSRYDTVPQAHPFVHVYSVQVPRNYEGIIKLSQSYNSGWKAYELKAESEKLNWMQSNFPFLFGTEIKDHVLVNNWANGWVLNSSKIKAESIKLKAESSNIVIVFWPQYLQYLGFGILELAFIAIIFWRNKK